MNVQIEQWELNVNQQQTMSFYEAAPYKNEDLFALNYIEVCSFGEPAVLQFFQQLAIDILKPSNLHFLPTEGDSVMYSGSYYVVGERLQGELDEWDVVVENFCFALTEDNYDQPANCPKPIVEISFEVVLPWMLFEPIPTL